MIISHKYKYVFVEVPHTGTTAIANELMRHYDGSRIYRKHTYYNYFYAKATPEDRQYFAFSGVRNPLDEAVSIYLKLKGNHKGNFTNPEKLVENGGFVTPNLLERYNYIQEREATFSGYFLEFYNKPFDNLSATSYKKMSAIIHFEHLGNDFLNILRHIGIEPIRPLPVLNKTTGKSGFMEFFKSEEVVMRALDVFGPFMLKWKYSFPPEWGAVDVSSFSIFKFNSMSILRKLHVRKVGVGA